MKTKEILEGVGNIATVGATIFAAVALYLSVEAFNQESANSQIRLFYEITSRIDGVIDQQKLYEEKGDIATWYIKVLNTLEYYALFVNRDYLQYESAMGEYYKSYIVTYCNNVPRYNAVQKYIEGRLKENPEEFNEIKALYKRFTNGKNTPF